MLPPWNTSFQVSQGNQRDQTHFPLLLPLPPVTDSADPITSHLKPTTGKMTMMKMKTTKTMTKMTMKMMMMTMRAKKKKTSKTRKKDENDKDNEEDDEEDENNKNENENENENNNDNIDEDCASGHLCKFFFLFFYTIINCSFTTAAPSTVTGPVSTVVPVTRSSHTRAFFFLFFMTFYMIIYIFFPL